MMAEAARYNVDHGAQIIDINMGCPAKKVCNVDGRLGAAAGRAAGGAHRRGAWSRAVDVPVTLKIRTGWDREQSQRACGRAHRRGCRHRSARRCTAARAPAAIRGEAEYDTIARGQVARSAFR